MSRHVNFFFGRRGCCRLSYTFRQFTVRKQAKAESAD